MSKFNLNNCLLKNFQIKYLKCSALEQFYFTKSRRRKITTKSHKTTTKRFLQSFRAARCHVSTYRYFGAVQLNISILYFSKYFRVNKSAFQYLLEEFTTKIRQSRSKSDIPCIVKLKL